MAFLRGGALLAAAALALAACGGKVRLDGAGAGAAGGGGSGSGSGKSCQDSSDCPGDDVCVWDTGTCAPSCDFSEVPCGEGLVCDDCATSSCPSCEDCKPACVAKKGQCDDHDDCPSGTVCVYYLGMCIEACDTDMPNCSNGAGCDPCATGSCPGCDDCLAACVP